MVKKDSGFSHNILAKLKDVETKQQDSTPVVEIFEILREELIPILERTEWGQRYVWQGEFNTPYIGPAEPTQSQYVWLGLVDESYKSFSRPSRALQLEFGIDASSATGFLGRDVMCGILLGPWAAEEVVATVSNSLQKHSTLFARFFAQYEEYILATKTDTLATPNSTTIEKIATDIDSGFAITRDIAWQELSDLDVLLTVGKTVSQLTPVYRQLAGIRDGPPVSSISSWDIDSLSAATTLDVSDITNTIDRLMDAGCSRKEATEYVRMYLRDMLRENGLFAIQGVGPSSGYSLGKAGVTSIEELHTANPTVVAENTTLTTEQVRSFQEAAQDSNFASLNPGDEHIGRQLRDVDSRLRINHPTNPVSEDETKASESGAKQTAPGTEEGVKILHVSDTHLRYKQYGTRERGRDFTKAFRDAVDIGLESNVDAIVHTGDILHNHDPVEDVVLDEAVEIIKRATKAGVQFLYIVGNHDYEFSSDAKSPLFDRIRDIDGVKGLGTDPTWIGNTVFYGIDHHYEDWWNENAITLSPPVNEPDQTILCLHQSVTPFISAENSDCSLADLLNDTSVTVDTVLLGHLHRNHVRTVDAVPSYYVGSPTRTSRRHGDYSPGVQVAQIGADGFQRERHSLTPRQFTEYTVVVGANGFPDSPNIDSVDGEVITAYVATSPDDCSIEYEHRTREIKRSFEQSGALYVGAVDRRDALTGVEAGIYEGSPVEVANRLAQAEYHGPRRVDYPGFLQVGGTFLGRWNFTPGRRDEFFERFEEISNYAIASNLSTLIQTGNLFGNPSPPEQAVNKAETALQVLQEAGVDSYHVPSQKEVDMEAIDQLVEAGLLNRLSSKPTVVDDGRLALYGTDPTPRAVIHTARSMEQADAEQSILCTHVPVVPPADGDEPQKRGSDPISYEELADALPEWVDTVCTGGVRHSAVKESTDGGPAIICGGEAERLLGEYCFNAAPAEGHIWRHRLTSDGWDRTTYTLDKYPLEAVELAAGFSADVDTLAGEVKNRTDVQGAIVAIRLTGNRHAGNKLRREAFEQRLQAAYAVEVYDDREVPPEKR